MDQDLRDEAKNVIDWLDKVKKERQEKIAEDIRLNGPKWVPQINRHFMDADNSTTDFGPEFHPAYPCVPTIAMRDPSTRMRESACRGRTQELLDHIKNEGADVNIPDPAGQYAAIHWAALMGYPDTLQAIIDVGANVSAVTRHRRTALHYAAEQGHMECVRVLLQANVALNVRDKSGNTAAMLAAKSGQDPASAAIDAAAASRNPPTTTPPPPHPQSVTATPPPPTTFPDSPTAAGAGRGEGNIEGDAQGML